VRKNDSVHYKRKKRGRKAKDRGLSVDQEGKKGGKTWVSITTQGKLNMYFPGSVEFRQDLRRERRQMQNSVGWLLGQGTSGHRHATQKGTKGGKRGGGILGSKSSRLVD